MAELREKGLAGSPEEVIDKIGTFADAGASRFYLQLLDLSDLDHLQLVAERVAPALGADLRRRSVNVPALSNANQEITWKRAPRTGWH